MAVVGEHHPAFEEYCECIFELAEDDVDVIQARIADRLNVSRPAVSEMMRRLETEGLIDSTSGIRLTPDGQLLATTVVRRHRLAERFLTDILGLPWADAHHEAGKWEHVMSEAVEGAMNRLLGSPTTCPHGNPIPGSDYIKPDFHPLSAVGVGDGFTVRRIPEELEFTPGLLEYLEASSLQPGHVGTITAASPDGTITVQIDGRHIGVGAYASARILVTALIAWAHRPILLALVSLAATSCAATTFDSSATTVPRSETVPTTVFEPTGTTGQLLDELSTEAAGLSALLVDDHGQHDALDRIEALWSLIRPEIETRRPELLVGFETVMDMVARSVERRRPADADKASKNLTVLVAAYQR